MTFAIKNRHNRYIAISTGLLRHRCCS